MSDQQVSGATNPCITDAPESSPPETSPTHVGAAWSKSLESIAVLNLADLDLSDPDALVERVRAFQTALFRQLREKDAELAALKQSVRAAVRQGWEESRALQEANKRDTGYVLGLRCASNTVAMYVYRAIHGE